MKPKVKVSKDSASSRGPITTKFLFVWFGLNDAYDPELPILLPTELPRSEGCTARSTKVTVVNAEIDKLVMFGCHQRAVYWCLGQAERLSQIKTDLSTREKMGQLSDQLAAAAEKIKDYRQELWMAAECLSENARLPQGLITAYESPEETILVTLQNLFWLSETARNWSSPNAGALLRNKDLLFLLVYVTQCSPVPNNQKGKRLAVGRARKPSRNQLSRFVRLALLIDEYFGRQISAEDLLAKVRDFRKNEPDVYTAMAVLLSRVHDAAATSN